MGRTVRGRVKRGTLELLEKVDLSEGEEVTATILEVPSKHDREKFRRTAGAWKDTVDADALIRHISPIASSRPAPNPANDPAQPRP